MAMLSREQIVSALRRIGELALEQGTTVDLLVVGGAYMVLALDAREATKDVDAIARPPQSLEQLRSLVAFVADEMGWPSDWLNDGAKGYLVGRSEEVKLLESPGIVVRGPATAQVLAMKLSAWRDDVDVSDARLLLARLLQAGAREEAWECLQPFLVPGSELKARYAFDDLCEEGP